MILQTPRTIQTTDMERIADKRAALYEQLFVNSNATKIMFLFFQQLYRHDMPAAAIPAA